MQQYRISQKGLKNLNKRLLLLTPVIVIIIIAAIVMGLYTGDDEQFYDNVQNELPTLIAIVFPAIAFIIYFARKWIKAVSKSYLLTVTDNMIIREQKNLPAISVYYSEITKITKTENGSFVITGKEKNNTIVIPPYMEDPEELQAALNNIMPVTATAVNVFLKILIVFYAVFLAIAIAYIFMGSNEYLINVFKGIIMCGGAWAFIMLIRNKNTDRRLKIFFRIILICMALGVIQAIIMWWIN